jgi:hypothetical protein
VALIYHFYFLINAIIIGLNMALVFIPHFPTLLIIKDYKECAKSQGKFAKQKKPLN